MRALVFPLIAILPLSACATASSESPALSGFVKQYPPSVLSQAADELEALPPDSALALMIADYGVLRAQLRAAQ